MQKALFNLPVLIVAAFSLAATAVISALVFANQPEPPTLLIEPAPAPDFTVTDHNGQTVTKDDLLGRVWVCDFFLTRCNAICPTLGRTMADLATDLSQDQVFADVRLISFSVDPEHDTVEELARYRLINGGVWDRDDKQRQEAIEKHWLHTRAESRETFWPIVDQGFGLAVGDSPDDPKSPVAHSGKLVLVDKRGNIRGYYDGLSDAEIPALLADIRRLVEEPDE